MRDTHLERAKDTVLSVLTDFQTLYNLKKLMGKFRSNSNLSIC